MGIVVHYRKLSRQKFTAVHELQTRRSRSWLTFCGTEASMAARALTKGIRT